MTLKVTFDSNTFRKILNPSSIKGSYERDVYGVIHEAIKIGKIQPYFSSAMFILEEPPRKDRGEHISKNRAKAVFNEWDGANGRIRDRAECSPDHSTAYLLSDYSILRLNIAIDLGFKMIHLPRFGRPMPSEILKLLKTITYSDDEEFHEKMN